MKNTALPKGLFITGTDTNVGKTYIGSQIVSLLYETGISVIPRKPIESGCKHQDGDFQAKDAKQYYEAVKKSIPLAEICPYRFEPAISPQRAARLANNPLSTHAVVQACLNKVTDNDFLLVEGAGGFYSPLCEDGLNADLAEALQLPLLLVAKDKLGCINQILLTAEAIQKRGLELAAVILNNKDFSNDDNMNNFEDLKSQLDIPIFSISNNETIQKDNKNIQKLLNTILSR